MDQNNFNNQPDSNFNQENKSASYTYYSNQSQPTTAYYYQPKPTPPQAPKNKPPKKSVSVTTLIICIILSVVISGGISTAISISNSTATSVTSDTQNKSYTVSATYDNYIEAVAEACTPSVVGIAVSYKTQAFSMFGGYSNQDNESSGSGVIYTNDGYIITNFHVVEAAVEYNGSVSVYLYDQQDEPIDATIIGYNSSYDLAVLKINKKGLQAINIGSAKELKTGQPCIAIGSPGGLEFMGSVNSGYISGLNRELTIDTYSMGLIQTDAAINPGNSGGALLNANGELIGIPSVKIAATEYENMGFAIAVDDVVTVCDDIIKHGGSTIQSTTPYLGVIIDTRYTSSILSQLGYPSGAYVSSVYENSPAEKAGIKASDVITAINKTTVTNYDELSAAIKKCNIGDKITITIYRDGQSGTVTAVLTSSTDAKTE